MLKAGNMLCLRASRRRNTAWSLVVYRVRDRRCTAWVVVVVVVVVETDASSLQG